MKKGLIFIWSTVLVCCALFDQGSNEGRLSRLKKFCLPGTKCSKNEVITSVPKTSCLPGEKCSKNEVTPSVPKTSCLPGEKCSKNEVIPSVPKTSCLPGEKCNLRIIHKLNSQVSAIYNVQTQAATAIYYEKNTAALLDGKKGIAIQIDLNTNRGYVKTQEISQTWVASKESFEVYMSNSYKLDNLTVFTKKDETFELYSPPPKYKEAIDKLIIDLEPEVNSLKVVKRPYFFAFIDIIKELCQTLRQKIWKLIKLKFELKGAILRGGLTKLLSVFEGLSILVKNAGKSIEKHIGILNFEPLMQTESGSETVAEIGRQVMDKEDAYISMSPCINEPEKMFEVITGFGGKIYSGLYAVESMIGHLMLLIRNKISLPNFLDILIQIVANIGRIKANIVQRTINTVSRVLDLQMSKYPRSRGKFTLITDNLTKLKEGNLVDKGLNISSILKHIFDLKKKSLNVIVNILASLGKVVSLPFAIAALLFRIVFCIVSGEGFMFIVKLLPKIKLPLDFYGKVPIIVQILKAVDPRTVVKKIVKFDIKGVLTSIPIFGTISQILISTLENIHITTKQFFKAILDNGFAKPIISWIKFGLGKQKDFKLDGHFYGLGPIRCVCPQI